MDRAERRRFKKAVGRQIPSMIASGFPTHVRPLDVAAIALGLTEELKKKKSAGRATACARLGHAVFDRTAANWPEPTTARAACRSGCSFCCHIFTTVTAPEALLISREIKENRSSDEIANIVERCKPLIGKNLDQRFGAKLPCPLLENDRCSVYAVRPTVCRKYASVSAADCEAAFNGDGREIPFLIKSMQIGSYASLALHAALQASDLPNEGYELSEVLMIALTVENAEERWSAGDNIFQDCQVDEGRSRAHRNEVDRLASMIR